MIDNPEKPKKIDSEKDRPQKRGDIHGTISEGEKPPKKIKLFFSKRIWVAILSFIVLTIIAGIIEFTVQTPISKYIERLTGPRLRTLRSQIKQGNYEFVFNAVKPKFHDEPFNKGYEQLYIQSTEGFLRDLIKEHEWEKASTFLEEAIVGMPIPKDHRLNLRRVYIEAQPERFQLFKKEERGRDAGERLNKLWKEVKLLALKEKDDPIVRYEAGRTLAEFDWVGGRYNLYSLEYFERALELDPQIKDKEIIYTVLDQALEGYSSQKMTKKAQNIIQTYYPDEYPPKLQEMLKPYPFKGNQVVEVVEIWNKRLNAFHILSNLGKLRPVDKFRFYLMTVAHFVWANEEKMKLIEEAKQYFKNLADSNSFRKIQMNAGLPKVVPVSVLSKENTAKEFLETWPLISGLPAPIFEGYCHDRLFYEHNWYLRKNCYKFLKETGKLTAKEEEKWQKLEE